MVDGAQLIADFQSPPVVEVVAGVSVDGLGSDVGPFLASFWKERLRSQFPRLEHQAPYAPPREQFPPSVGPPGIQFEVEQGLPPARLWASSPDHQELIQLQPGWFACNWRKVKPNDEYDHWPRRRSAFVRWFSELSEYLGSEGVGVPKVVQCEVTYVNHIQPGATWAAHADFERAFAVRLGQSSAGRLEQVTAQAQFVLEESDVPFGRLHVKLLPGFARDGRSPLYVLELTARGPALGDGVEGAATFLDKGREAIVRAFLDLTTDQIQAEWGKVQ